MKDDCTLPEKVEYKSCAATIYLQKNRKAIRFEVRYHDVDGSMQRLTFPTYSSAKKFAETAVKEIPANREHFVTLRGRAAFEFQMAVETLTPLGLTIVQAATLIADNHRQLAGAGTLPDPGEKEVREGDVFDYNLRDVFQPANFNYAGAEDG